MKISNWAHNTSHDAELISPTSVVELKLLVADYDQIITQGNQANYNDCALAEKIITTKQLNKITEFNPDTGIITCQSGVNIKQLLTHITPQKWLLPVIPGTYEATIGGAIASDVHGKNHYHFGSFTEHVLSLSLLTAQGQIIRCDRSQHHDLLLNTCGGMGLTGIVLSVTIQLIKISSSQLVSKQIKTTSLKNTLLTMEQHTHEDYMVAWINGSSSKEQMGLGIVNLASHSDQDKQTAAVAPIKKPMSLPISWILNPITQRLFNWFYPFKARYKIKHVDLFTFFFPLNKIKDAKVLYGKKGVTQYQCVFPQEHSYDGILELLLLVKKSKQTMYLISIKKMGPANKNTFSFPLKGYTLAIDFKMDQRLKELFTQMDETVTKYCGKVYLCKNRRISKEVFQKHYPQYVNFKQVKQQVDPQGKFQSLLSQRLGL